MKNFKSVKLIRLIQIAVIILAVIAVICVLKISDRLLPKHSITNPSANTQAIEITDYEYTVQTFEAKEAYLKSIGLRIKDAMPDAGQGGLYIQLKDENDTVIAQASTLLSMMPVDAAYYFLLDVTLVPGEPYFLSVSATVEDENYPNLLITDISKNNSTENKYITRDGDVIGTVALVTDYEYLSVMPKWIIALGILLIVLVMAIVLFLIPRVLPQKILKYEITTEAPQQLWSFAGRHGAFVLCSIIAVYTILFITLIFNDNIWTDEAYTIDLLKNCRSIQDVWEFTGGDVHPPLYYMILLPFSNLFGIQLQLLKILSIIPMILTLLLGAFTIRRRFGNRVAALFIMMLTAMPVMMEYVVQVRMYTWALLFITVAGLSAFQAYETGKVRYYIYLGLAGTAAAYTHYFAFTAALWIYGFLFLAILISVIRKRNSIIELVKWITVSVLSAVLFLPWLPYMMKQVSGVSRSYWIAPVTKEVVIEYFDWFFETDLPYSAVLLKILMVAAIIIIAYRFIVSLRKKSRNMSETRLCVSVTLGFVVLLATVATGIVLSRLIRPIFIIRYGIPCLGILSLFWAYAIGRLKKSIVVVAFVFCLLLSIVVYQETQQQEYHSTTVPQMEEFFDQHLGDNDYVVYNYKAFDFIYAYYFEPDTMRYFEEFDWNSDFDDVWYLCTAFNPDFTGEQISEYNLDIIFVGNYNIEHNQFVLYQVRKK